MILYLNIFLKIVSTTKKTMNPKPVPIKTKTSITTVNVMKDTINQVLNVSVPSMKMFSLKVIST